MAATPTGRAIRDRALAYATRQIERKYRLQGRDDAWFAANARLIATTAKLSVNGGLLALARVNLVREAERAQ